MLLDPFEKQFDLPTATVELSDGQSRYGKVVGQDDQSSSGLRSAKANASESLRIALMGIETAQNDGLIQAQAGGFVHRTGRASKEAEVAPGAGHKKSSALMQTVEPGKIQITTVGDIEGARLVTKLVENIDVVNLAGAQDYYGGEVATQCQQSVEFDRGFVSAKLRPRKQRQAQIDGGRVQSIGGFLEVDAEGFVGIEDAGLLNENLSEVGEDPPVAFFVRIGQSASRSGLANATVIEFGTQCAEAGFDIPQAFSVGQLSESQNQELLVSGQRANPMIASITTNTFVEFVFGEFVHELGEHGSAFVHNGFFPRLRAGKTCETAVPK